MFVVGCGAKGPTPAQPEKSDPGIEGQWVSVEFGGRNVGDFMKEVCYVFKADGTFTIAATMTNGTTSVFEGTYLVQPSTLELSIPDVGTKQMPYTLSGDTLTVKDPELDSWIRYKRSDVAE